MTIRSQRSKRFYLLTFSAIAAAVGLNTGADAATFFTTPVTYQAASKGNVAYDFAGIAPAGSFQDVGSSYTRGPVEFTTAGSGFIIDTNYAGGSFYNGRAFYSSQPSTSTVLNLGGVTAFSLNYGSYGDSNGPVTFTLNDGSTYATTFPAAYDATSFLGFTSNVGISSLTIGNPNTSYGITDVLNFQVGSIAPLPEPSTWAMMIGGFGMIGGSMRSARRKTKVSFATA
jgi:hypothetical protein